MCVCLFNASQPKIYETNGEREQVVDEVFVERNVSFRRCHLFGPRVKIEMCAYECDQFQLPCLAVRHWKRKETKNIRNLVKFKFHTCSHQVIPSVRSWSWLIVFLHRFSFIFFIHLKSATSFLFFSFCCVYPKWNLFSICLHSIYGSTMTWTASTILEEKSKHIQ